MALRLLSGTGMRRYFFLQVVIIITLVSTHGTAKVEVLHRETHADYFILQYFILRERNSHRRYNKFLNANYPLTGASDHGVSEAIYLDDPDGNGVELYWDKPKEKWPLDGSGKLQNGYRSARPGGFAERSAVDGHIDRYFLRRFLAFFTCVFLKSLMTSQYSLPYLQKFRNWQVYLYLLRCTLLIHLQHNLNYW